MKLVMRLAKVMRTSARPAGEGEDADRRRVTTTATRVMSPRRRTATTGEDE